MEYDMLNSAKRSRNVAIYARVSTAHEEQLSALENQKEWYKPYLTQHLEWKLVEMYVDEGITGTSAQKRPEFLRMIQDAKAGKFDLILTREVSRFARNTVDTLNYTRELKRKGIEVFFINDNIKTFDGDGELRLTIMATLAQDESRKTSIRVKSGQKTSMQNGVFYGNGNILGYDRVGRDLVINPEQAKTVRMIYDWYLQGWGLRKIQFELEKCTRLTATGLKKWSVTTVNDVLKNPFYSGIITYRKQFVPDFLEQKKITNHGEVDQVTVMGTHAPIVSVDEFEAVQKIMESRRQNLPAGQNQKSNGVRKPINVWTKLLVCQCGRRFNRTKWHTTATETQYGYQCYSMLRTGTVKTRLKKGLSTEGICDSSVLAGWKLQMMAKFIFRNYLSDTARVLRLAEAMLEKHIDDPEEEVVDNTLLIEEKRAEIKKLEMRMDNLIEMRADGEITKDVFKKKKDDLTQLIYALETEIRDLQPQEEEVEEEATHEEKITVLKYALECYTDFERADDIPEEVVDAFVKKILVAKDHCDWYIRFGDVNPVQCVVEGKRKKNATVSLFCTTQHRLL